MAELDHIPSYLQAGAFVVLAVVAILHALGNVVPKLRGAVKSERIDSDPPRGNGSAPVTPAQGFLVLGERISGLREHIDVRFDELGGRIVAVEKTAATNSNAIARLEGLDEARHDTAGMTGPHRRT